MLFGVEFASTAFITSLLALKKCEAATLEIQRPCFGWFLLILGWNRRGELANKAKTSVSSRHHTPVFGVLPRLRKGSTMSFFRSPLLGSCFFSYFTYKTCNLRLFRAPYIFLFASSGTFKMTQYNSYKYENIKLTLTKPPYLWIIKQNLAQKKILGNFKTNS